MLIRGKAWGALPIIACHERALDADLRCAKHDDGT